MAPYNKNTVLCIGPSTSRLWFGGYCKLCSGLKFGTEGLEVWVYALRQRESHVEMQKRSPRLKGQSIQRLSSVAGRGSEIDGLGLEASRSIMGNSRFQGTMNANV